MDNYIFIGRNNIEVPKKSIGSIIQLTYQETYIISVLEPFCFRYSLWKPSHFYTGLEVHSETESWRSFRLKNDLFVIAKMFMIDNMFYAEIFSNQKMNEADHNKLRKRLIHSYGLQEKNYIDYKLLNMIGDDLYDLYGMRISCPENYFEISVLSLILQNTTVKRTTDMLKLLLDTYGRLVECENIILKVFFTPDELIGISEENLKTICKLGYRARFIKNYAAFFSDNHEGVLEELDEISLINKLQTIKGVGPYTSNVIASHVMRSKTAIPLDCWNRKILGKVLYQDETIEGQKLLRNMSDDFQGICGVIALYIIENQFKNCPVTSLIDESGQMGDYYGTNDIV